MSNETKLEMLDMPVGDFIDPIPFMHPGESIEQWKQSFKGLKELYAFVENSSGFKGYVDLQRFWQAVALGTEDPRMTMSLFKKFLPAASTIKQTADIFSQHEAEFMVVTSDESPDTFLGLVWRKSFFNNFSQVAINHLEDISRYKEQLANRNEFLEIVAHDIRAPLGVIQVCIDFLEVQNERTQSLTNEQRDFLSRISRNAGKALGLVSDLLDIGRLKRGMKLTLETVNVNQFLNKLSDGFKVVATNKGLKFDTDCEENLHIAIDQNRFQQIVENFMGNAFKFSPKGSKVSLIAKTVDHKNKKWVKISVKDEGPGIPTDQLNSVFNKYEQMDVISNVKSLGVGLGLSIAQQFAKLHGAEILVESVQGKGSTFSVLMPLVPAFVQEVKMAGHLNILIVEDDVDILAFMVETFESDPKFSVFKAENGTKAVEILKNKDVELDMVISDIKMPDMDGIELLEQVKKIKPNMPFIFTSGFFISISDDAAKNVFNADDILTKPFDSDDLYQAVIRALEKHGYQFEDSTTTAEGETI